MRMIAIAAAAVVILSGAATGAAWAGLPTTPNRSGPPPAPAATNTPATSELTTNPLIGGDVSRIEGIPVDGEDGKLGYVSRALIDPQTEKIDRLVVTAGGVLGTGGTPEWPNTRILGGTRCGGDLLARHTRRAVELPMHKIPIVAVAALAMLSVAASAQTTPSPSRPSTPGAAPAPIHREPAINPLTKDDVSKIEGTTVYGSDNAQLGSVSTVLMDPQSKKLDRLVVKAGGLLGMGGHRVAIPIDQFKWDGEKAGFRLSMTADSLKSMPAWVEGAEGTTGSSEPPRSEKPLTGAGDGAKTSR